MGTRLRSRRRKRSLPDVKVTGKGTPAYEVLSESDLEKLIDATFQLLIETGVAFDPDPQVLDRFSDAGCEITADHVVRFERDFVMECLATLAKSAKIWNREGTGYREIKDGVTSFIPGMTCIKICDLDTGDPRESTSDDLATATRVADALPNIDGVCVMVKDIPNSTLRGEIGEFVTMAENTTKPLEYLCDNSLALDAVIEMAAAIRGGMDQLAEKPYFNHIITPLPLYYAKTHTDQIIRSVDCGVPVTMGTISIGGASAPLTIAGCMIHSIATDLAGMAFSQLVRKGSFCIGTSENSIMEPATGSLGNRVPDMLADIATRQVMSHFGLPPTRWGRWGRFECSSLQPRCGFRNCNGDDERILLAADHSRLHGQSRCGDHLLTARVTALRGSRGNPSRHGSVTEDRRRPARDLGEPSTRAHARGDAKAARYDPGQIRNRVNSDALLGRTHRE